MSPTSATPLTEAEASLLLALLDMPDGDAPSGPEDPVTLERLRARGLVAPDAHAVTDAGRAAATVLRSPDQAAGVLADRILKLDADDRDAVAERLAAIMSPVLARSLAAWAVLAPDEG